MTACCSDSQLLWHVGSDLRHCHCRHADLAPLAAAWQQYAADFVTQHGHPAAKLDFHGCPGRISRSKDPMLLHTAGTILKATSAAWHVLSTADRVVVCPKAVCDWTFQVSGQTMVLSGKLS